MRKKIFSIILSLALILTLAPTSVYAVEDDVTIQGNTIVKDTWEVGETVSVPVKTIANSGFITGSIKVTWDTTAFKLKDVEYGFAPNYNSAPITESTASPYYVLFGNDLNTADYTNVDTLFTLKFEVLSGAKPQTYSIGLEEEANSFLKSGENGGLAQTITPTVRSTAITLKALASTIKINSYQGKPYDGQAVSNPTDITKTGSAGAVTFAYYDNEACTTPLSEVPKNAGNYWVKATVAGDESHEGATSAAKAFTIEKANYTFNEALLGLKKDVFIGNSYPQNGAAEAEGVTLPDDTAETVQGTISWYTDKALKNPAADGKFNKVGNTTLYYVFIPNTTETNYVSEPKTGSFTFKVTDLPLQVFTGEFGKAVSKTYGDTAFIVPAATTQGGEISYKSGNEKVATVNEKTGEVTIVGAGTAVITATAAQVTVGEQKYAATEKSYTLTVAQKKLTNADLLNKSVTLTKEYDGSKNANQLVKFEVNPAAMVKAEDKVEVDYHAEFNSKDVGSVNKITVNFEAYSGAGYENYTLDVSTIELTEGVAITAKPVTVVVDAAERPYGQANPSFTGALKEGSALAVGEDYDVLNMQYSSTATEASPVGTYEVTGTSDNHNYNVTVEGTNKLTVTKAEPTGADFVLSGNDTISYDANTHAVTVKAKTDIVGMGDITVKYNGKSELPKNAGTYQISIDVAEGTNYAAKANIEIGSFVIEKIAPSAADFAFTAPANLVFNGKAKYAQVVPAAGIEGMGNISVKYNGETTAPSAIGTYTVTVAVAAGSNYLAAESIEDSSWTFTIAKATAPTFEELVKTVQYQDRKEQTVDLSKLMPSAAGKLTYAIGTVAGMHPAIIAETPAISEAGILTFKLSDNSVDIGMNAIIPVTITSDNYEPATVNVKVWTELKEVPTLNVADIKVDYGTSVTKADIKGTATVNGTTIAGTWKFKKADDLTISQVAESGSYVVVFTPDVVAGETEYPTVEETILVTITPAKITGTLDFGKVTTAGTTLGDIKPTDFTNLSQQGTFAWNDGDAQLIEQGKAYGWTFTPNDSNYAVLSGTVTPWASSGGGGGGGFVIPTDTPEKVAKDFIKNSLTINGAVVKTADADNYTKVLEAAEKYDKLSVAEKTAVDKEMKAQTGKTMAELKAEAEAIKASIGDSSFDVQKAVKELTLKARSAKLKSGNIKITIKGDVSEIEKNGYTVKYKFYRSTKKAKGYKAAVTKDVPNYLNTAGKKGTMYYYKARVMVYDKDGNLVAKTELKQCKYANRKWTKK